MRYKVQSQSQRQLHSFVSPVPDRKSDEKVVRPRPIRKDYDYSEKFLKKPQNLDKMFRQADDYFDVKQGLLRQGWRIELKQKQEDPDRTRYDECRGLRLRESSLPSIHSSRFK